MENILEKSAELTPEQKVDQLIEKVSKLQQEKKEMIDDNLLSDDPILRAKQEDIDKTLEEIEAIRGNVESVEDTRSPEVVTAGEIVDEKFANLGLERGIATQNELAQKELQKINEKILQTEEDIKNSKSEDESLGLKFILLGLKKKSDNIKEGLELEEKRKENTLDKEAA